MKTNVHLKILYRPLCTLCLVVLLAANTGCQKEFLDAKPDKALLVPETNADYWALLDQLQVFNTAAGLTGIADGDFVTTDAGWTSYGTDQERNSYVWAQDIFGSSTSYDWDYLYKQVFYANVVLDGLAARAEQAPLDAEALAIKGTALFHRAFAFHGLVTLFARAYQPSSAGTDPGIPLRLTSAVTAKVPRGTVEAVYTQLIADLKEARRLLPLQSSYKSRPVVPAAFALLSRTYLSMSDYPNAGHYADSSLQLSSGLIDYNTLTATASRPFPRALPSGNPEVLFYASWTYSFSGNSAITYCDPQLYQSYAANDLRKTCFFRDAGGGNYGFKGTYTGVLPQFGGLATDEMYLTRAESGARAGNTASALQDLNTLLATRWKKGTFVPLTAADAPAALKLVLTERRKELIGRNLRWLDLKRLNLDPATQVTLTRKLKGVDYSLAPGSPRYVYPIAANELQLGGLTQNER
jgi:hypothetical protein